jgi:GH18 family chitinase
MADATCTVPGCTFSTSGIPGSCTNSGGTLSYSEIVSRNNSLDVSTYYDETSTVKYNVFEGSQWVSYDDEQSFHDKKKFISSRCLSGVMIWAIDQDTTDYAALSGLFGDLTSTELFCHTNLHRWNRQAER